MPAIETAQQFIRTAYPEYGSSPELLMRNMRMALDATRRIAKTHCLDTTRLATEDKFIKDIEFDLVSYQGVPKEQASEIARTGLVFFSQTMLITIKDNLPSLSPFIERKLIESVWNNFIPGDTLSLNNHIRSLAIYIKQEAYWEDINEKNHNATGRNSHDDTSDNHQDDLSLEGNTTTIQQNLFRPSTAIENDPRDFLETNDQLTTEQKEILTLMYLITTSDNSDEVRAYRNRLSFFSQDQIGDAKTQLAHILNPLFSKAKKFEVKQTKRKKIIQNFKMFLQEEDISSETIFQHIDYLYSTHGLSYEETSTLTHQFGYFSSDETFDYYVKNQKIHEIKYNQLLESGLQTLQNAIKTKIKISSTRSIRNIINFIDQETFSRGLPIGKDRLKQSKNLTETVQKIHAFKENHPELFIKIIQKEEQRQLVEKVEQLFLTLRPGEKISLKTLIKDPSLLLKQRLEKEKKNYKEKNLYMSIYRLLQTILLKLEQGKISSSLQGKILFIAEKFQDPNMLALFSLQKKINPVALRQLALALEYTQITQQFSIDELSTIIDSTPRAIAHHITSTYDF